jgi:hypothetical protein
MATRILSIPIPEPGILDDLDIHLSEGYRVVNSEPIQVGDTHIVLILHKPSDTPNLSGAEALTLWREHHEQ